MAQCPECGASGGAQWCAELFHRLLDLDYSRQEPWGPHHGVTTPCYLLQHPSRMRGGAREHPWILIHAFLDGGLDQLHRFVERARAANSHRHGEDTALPRPPGTPPMPARTPPTRFGTTIAEVAADGGFPADGFTERVRDWAADTSAAWLSESDRL